MSALEQVMLEIFTPESADDGKLGVTMIFGHDLTPDETTRLAQQLLIHAQIARAVTPKETDWPKLAREILDNDREALLDRLPKHVDAAIREQEQGR